MSSPTVLQACLRPDWDATLTVDALEEGGQERGVFVGREDLLQPLQAAIVDLHKRGTVLVSGYRGSGKTTLVLKALCNARQALASGAGTTPAAAGEAPGVRLLPLVLNVSEIWTSLAVTMPAAPRVDPRRLLIALLRAFRQRAEGLGDAALRTRVEQLYDKATAAEFKIAQSDERAEEVLVQRELGLGAQSKDLFKGALVPAGLLALGLAALGPAGDALAQLVKAATAAGALGAVAVGLTLQFKATRKDERKQARRSHWVHDNSLQQLENDLKDLLGELARRHFRTVVVLEELDKLDGRGKELDEVIRYFKNLFTQAPALFIFVTDKVYFDRIGSEIAEARRKRSYAMAHIFFTHRWFVGRPDTRDCLRFVEALLRDEADRAVVRAIYSSRRWATESFGHPGAQAAAAQPALGLFVRVLLFRASNHLFDLKAELQRFVRSTPQGPVLVFDADMFPPEEQALAKFQDLLADKVRTFGFKGGRGYANEVLHDCLAGVFHEVGSARRRTLADLLPADAGAGDEGLLLDPRERQRIEEALQSLCGDLRNGGALLPGVEAIEWVPEPAHAFSLLRKLEAHEERFVARLAELERRLVAIEAVAGEAEAALQAELADWRRRVQQRIDSAADLNTSVGVEEALHEQRETEAAVQSLRARLLADVAAQAAREHGLVFEPPALGPSLPGESVRLLRTRDNGLLAAPASSAARAGGVLLVLGDREEAFAEVERWLHGARPLRVALIHLLDPPDHEARRAEVEQRWDGILSSLAEQGAPAGEWNARFLLLSMEQLGGGSGGRLRSRHLAALLLREALWALAPPHGAGAPLPAEAKRLAPAVGRWLRETALAPNEPPGALMLDGLAGPADPVQLAESVRAAIWHLNQRQPWHLVLPASAFALPRWPARVGLDGDDPAPLEPAHLQARGDRLRELASETDVVLVLSSLQDLEELYGSRRINRHWCAAGPAGQPWQREQETLAPQPRAAGGGEPQAVQLAWGRAFAEDVLANVTTPAADAHAPARSTTALRAR